MRGAWILRLARVARHRAGLIARVAWLPAAISLPGMCLLMAQQPAQKSKPDPPPAVQPASAATDDNLPRGEWAPELLDAILSSSNPSAAESLYDAAFAAGPELIPQLEAALKDDRTAEFAAQCLAFLGGERPQQILESLISDPRDLDLRRFYLGALGEYPAPEIAQLLLNAVAKSDREPDRTVTEAAIWALTVRSGAGMPSQLQQAEAKIQDVAIRDDVDNARQVIEARTRYLASPQGRNAGGSIPEAVRTYFIGALEDEPTPPAGKTAAGAPPSPPEPPPARAEVNRITFSPDQTRALAHVTFEDAEARANYDMVVQKQLGEWKVVSVWQGATVEKPESTAIAAPRPKSQTPAKPSRTSQPSH